MNSALVHERRPLRAIVWLAAAMACLPGPAQSPAQESPGAARSRSAPQGRWAATAPGRVESRSQEIRIAAPVPGRIAEVLAKANDDVFAGELLVRLDDQEAIARVAAAEAQVALRKRARDAEKRKGSAARRRAEDNVADAETEVAEARSALDKAAAERRASKTSGAALDAARAALARAQDRLRQPQEALRNVDADAPLPTRVEGELTVARAELAGAQAALEKTRIRAPFAATVLQVRAKVGEVASPSSEQPLLLLGDMSALRVKAELDERDFAKVRTGQRVSIRAHAFPDREFEGRVQSIARYVSPGRAGSAPRSKSTDFDIVEVIVDLTNPGPLLVGMQVDAYFNSETAGQQGAR